MLRLFRTRPASAARTSDRRSRPRLETLGDRCLLSAGVLDTTFAAPNGFVTKDFGSTNDSARNLAVQPWDDAPLVGTNAPSNGGDFAVTRYTKDGALDTSFGVGGTATVDFARGFDNVMQVLADPTSHKIVLVGKAQTGTSAQVFAAARLNPNGSLDTTFGTRGKTTINVWNDASVQQTPNAAALDGQGRIVIAGVGMNYPKQSSTAYFYNAVVRLTAGGALDSTFGTGGVLHGAAEPHTAPWRDLRVEADNSIDVVGINAGTNVIAHVTTLGSIDRTTPLYVRSAGSGYSIQQPNSFDPVGNVICNGVVETTHGEISSLSRDLAADGQEDTTFGTAGMVTPDLSAYFATHVPSYPELAAYVNSHDMTGHTIVAADSLSTPAYDVAGRLVVAGNTSVFDQSTDASGNVQNVPIQVYSLLLRFTPDGTQDTSFGLDGVSATDLRTGYNQSFSRVAFQSDGRIMAAGTVNMGSTTASNTDVSLARFTADPQPTTLTTATATSLQTTQTATPVTTSATLVQAPDGTAALPPGSLVLTQADPGPFTPPSRSPWRPWR